MKLTVEIDMDNSAFADHPGAGELAKCLNQVVEKIGNQSEGKIRDSNGNTVGSWSVE
jgi:hypothetical protein